MSQEICNISNSSLEKSSVDEKQLSTLDNGDPLALPANIPDNMVYKWFSWYGEFGDSMNRRRMSDDLYSFVPPSRHPEYERDVLFAPVKDSICRKGMVLVERHKKLDDVIFGRLNMINEALKNGVSTEVGRKTWDAICANRGSGRYAEAILQVKPRDIKQIEESAKQIESDKLLIGN